MQSNYFKVPIVPLNLRPEEYRIQVADALLHLKNVKISTFQKINDRINNKKHNLQNLKLRILQCQNRIENLRGKQEATKILNKSKYPGSETFNFPETIFSFMDNLYEAKRKYHDIQMKFEQIETKVKSVPIKNFFFSRQINQAKADRIGIGSIPSNLISISSLLLFNTNVHVYKNYVIMNPLDDLLTAPREDTADINDKTPCAAPPSIAQGEDIWIPPRENLFYIPGLGQVPSLENLPEVLPELGQVAINSGFTIESGPSLAPSVAIIDPTAFPELPELDETRSTVDVVGEALLGIAGPGRPSTHVDILASPPPPPPPPTLAPPPPPPPPPPPTMGHPQMNVSNGPIVPDPDAGRNDLLKQIVAVGGINGAKLKPAAQKHNRSAKKKKDQTDEVPLNMIEEMQKRLKMRRMGMMGRGDDIDDEGEDDTSLRDNIGSGVYREMSQKIPHIPNTNSQDDGSWSDDD